MDPLCIEVKENYAVKEKSDIMPELLKQKLSSVKPMGLIPRAHRMR